MNWIKQNDQRLFSILLIIGLMFLLFQNSTLKKKLDATKIQKINNDSEAKQVKIEYLEKDIKSLNDSVRTIAALRKQDSIRVEKYKKEIDRLKIAKHEKYIAIDKLSGHGLYDFFAKLNPGSTSEGK